MNEYRNTLADIHQSCPSWYSYILNDPAAKNILMSYIRNLTRKPYQNSNYMSEKLHENYFSDFLPMHENYISKIYIDKRTRTYI